MKERVKLRSVRLALHFNVGDFVEREVSTESFVFQDPIETTDELYEHLTRVDELF